MRAFATILVLALTTATIASQQAPLTILSAGPTGEITRDADANQIRITFSEPMVALGVVPDGRAPAWLLMQPAWPGAFYWAGSKTLIFSPEAGKPLPRSTTFRISIDTTATSAAGRRLAAPFALTFTTPTLRMTHAWARRETQRYDSPVLLELSFNQTIRDEDVLAHVHVSMQPHAWERPAPSPDEREYWQNTDPDGLARFERKVMEVDRLAASSDPLQLRIAERRHWDMRWDDSPGRTVLETTTSPPPGAWLRIDIDEAMPVPEGTAPHGRQVDTVKLEFERPLFLAHCAKCDPRPRAMSAVFFTSSVSSEGARRAIRVTDVTDSQAPRELSGDAALGDAYSTGKGSAVTLAQRTAMSRWQVRVSDLQSQDGQMLGYSWAGLSERGHDNADFAFGGSVFEAGSGSQLPFVSRNVASFKRWLLPVTPSSLVPTLNSIFERNLGGDLYFTNAQPPGTGDVTRLTPTPDRPQRHPLEIRELLTNGTGLLWATAREATTIENRMVFPDLFGGSFSSVVQITNLGITVKDGPLSTLVFVTRLDTGAPVDDAVVTIRDRNNNARWTGRTGSDGVTVASAVALRVGPYDPRLVVTAEKNGDTAFVRSTWNAGGQGGNQSLRYSSWYTRDRILRGMLFSDRGAYRAGDRVRIKSVLREDTRTGMTLLPPGTPLDLIITDPRYDEPVRQRVTASEWSSIEWTWTIPTDAPLGRYGLELKRKIPGETDSEESIYGTFIVADYKTPEFRVNATLSSDTGTLGTPIRGRVEARYLFGGAVGARPVSWSLRRSPSWTVPDPVRKTYPQAKYDIGYYPGYRRGESTEDDFRSEQTKLSEDGNAEFTIPTATDDATHEYTFEASVSAASEQNVAGRASLTVYPSSIFVAVARPSRFVTGRDGTTVSVAAVDHNGRAVPGVPIELTLTGTEWNYNSSSTKTETPAGSWTVTSTASDVPVRLTFPRSGSYVLRAIARDSAGRTTRTESTFYSVGSGRTLWRSDGNRIELVPERPSWKPGENARILIQSPWERATALLTVEREGIRRHQTFEVTSMQDTIEVPITEADVPNVFVSVVLVKGRTSEPRAADGSDPGRPAYRVGHLELKVDPARKRLNVAVSADRQEYRPGHQASVGVHVKDADGRSSSSEVTFWAVDEGVLSLTGYTLPDVVEEIYQPKGLNVMTSDNREQLLMALDGDSGPQPFPTVPRILSPSVVDTQSAAQRLFFERLPGFGRDGTRKDFRPLVFWLASMTTGADGEGRTNVRLPDSLTAYRIMAVAADRQSRFGSGELEIRAAKPLAVLPVLPRFLSVGDRAALGATVTYSGTGDVTATVTLETSDERVVQFETPSTRVTQIAAGRPTAITFEAVARDVGRSRIRVTIKAGQERDAFEMWLPVTAPRRPQVTAAYGTVSNLAAEEKLQVPAGADTSRGALTVELASTAMVGLGEGARYVVSYPHECAEQRASRALVYLLSSKLESAYHLSTGPENYRVAAEANLKALANYECNSGDLGLFPGQCEHPSPYISAYALHVLNVARRLGVDVEPLRRRSVESLRNELTRPEEGTNDDLRWFHGNRPAYIAFVAKVLVDAGEKVSLDSIPLLADTEKLPIFALSYLADVYHAQGNHGPEYQNLVLRITNALRVIADGAHVEERDEAGLGWMWLDDVGATAIVLEGFARRGDAPEMVVPLVRWLMSERRNGHWGQTHADARALEALVTYYSTFEDTDPQMIATTTIGNSSVAKTRFKGHSTRAQQVVLTMRELREHLSASASPSLTISRAGQGTVHYTARLEAYVPEDRGAFDRGFAVERSYERVTPKARDADPLTFAAGDIIRVRVRITLRSDGQYLALTDPLPAGFEALDEHFETTQREHGERSDWRWENYEFDHVEKHDDRVLAYATYMEPGTHELSYFVRAVTAGTFSANGATLEAMYRPEWSGRSAAVTVRVR